MFLIWRGRNINIPAFINTLILKIYFKAYNRYFCYNAFICKDPDIIDYYTIKIAETVKRGSLRSNCQNSAISSKAGRKGGREEGGREEGPRLNTLKF